MLMIQSNLLEIECLDTKNKTPQTILKSVYFLLLSEPEIYLPTYMNTF